MAIIEVIMLPLSANNDFKDYGAVGENPYRDINGDDLSVQSEVYGTDALDQAIEAVIVTEPYERLFNIDFWSPFYRLLFQNEGDGERIVEEVFQMIEKWVGVRIDRENANVEVRSFEHAVVLRIPYYFGDNQYHVFSRVISA